MKTAMCGIFFFSGVSALIFEMLWFQLAGLTFGNSVWATSIVLCSFMGGLALGNGLVAFQGHKIKSPVLFYALLETAIAISGYGLVLLFPKLTNFLAPIFQYFSGQTHLLNVMRSTIAFLLMLIPSTAMGATLPVLVKVLYAQDANFGRVLGVLYGWNTLGAMAGVLFAEIGLLKWFGIRGTGFISVIFNFIAVIMSLCLWGNVRKKDTNIIDTKPPGIYSYFSSNANKLMLASFLSGLTLLALEVVWFRFIILFFSSHSLNFAMMLAAVLSGISMGGLFASRWFKIQQKAHKFLPAIFLVSGMLIVITYYSCIFTLNLFPESSSEVRISVVSFFLIFPISFISGIIFTMLGKALHVEIKSETKAAGLLTLANTTGGMIGSLVAVFLIPFIGIEKSFFLFAIVYGAVGFLIFDIQQLNSFKKYLSLNHLAVGIFLVSLCFFPFDLMQREFLPKSCENYLKKGEKRIAFKESLTETIQYLQKDLLGQPYYHTLMTNHFAMSGTHIFNKRYMKLFTYWPIAVHPNPKNALLICFGCGVTAKALTDTENLENIEIVDISKDIIEMSKFVFRDSSTNPINDHRVKIHIEDGRFFLLTTGHKYDLITAEPPPPASKGIANLYSQEYFQLIYDRLAENGITTYWLPAHLLMVPESKSIIKGFCNVFKDCSLWEGAGFNFMMVGTKNLQGPVLEKDFVRQWNNNIVGSEMRALGFENPEQFGSLFIADGQRLSNWISESLPLIDDFPQRVSYKSYKLSKDMKGYREIMDYTASRSNFISSKSIAKIWPNTLRQKAEKYFEVRDIINEINLDSRLSQITLLTILHKCIQDPLLENYILWAFLSDQYAQEIITQALIERPERSFDDLVSFFGLAARAAQRRDYLSAEYYLGLAAKKIELTIEGCYYITMYRMYLLYIAKDEKKAKEIGQEYIDIQEEGKSKRRQQIYEYWNWLTSVVNNSMEQFLSN